MAAGVGYGTIGTGGQNQAMASEPRHSEIRERLDAINHNLDTLTQAIALLEDKLAVVLTPDAPVPQGKERGAENIVQTGLGNDLRALNDQLYHSIERLTSLRIRVAL